MQLHAGGWGDLLAVFQFEEDKKMDIPLKFYKTTAEGYPVVVKTVGDLIAALGELPTDLEINQEYSSSGGAEVVVYNIDEDRHLCFCENEQDEGGEDFDED